MQNHLPCTGLDRNTLAGLTSYCILARTAQSLEQICKAACTSLFALIFDLLILYFLLFCAVFHKRRRKSSVRIADSQKCRNRCLSGMSRISA